MDRLGGQFHIPALPRQFIRPVASHHTGGIERWTLHDITHELRKCLLNQLSGDMTRGIGIVYGMLTVVTGRSGTQLERSSVFLCMKLQRLDILRHLTRTQYQHPCCQGVKRTGMPHLHPLHVQTFRHEITDMCQRPKARHAIGLIDIDEGTFLEVHLIDHCK